MHTNLGPATQHIVVLAGPSAVGKTTIVHQLTTLIPNLYFSVSVTTRPSRPGEQDGLDYHFISKEEFSRLIEDDALLEWADIHGGLQRSGTPAQPIMEALEQGRPVLIEVDVVGARAIKKKIPYATSVFIAPPDWETLEQRLLSRGTEDPNIMQRRLQTARTELTAQDEFDRVIVNEQVEIVCQELITLLTDPDSATL